MGDKMFRISLLIMMSIAALCISACEYPWVQIGPNSKCYLVTHEKVTWYEGDMLCKQSGGMLAEPRSAAETELIDQFCLSDGYYWIGLTDLVEEGTFLWDSDYSVPDYTNWNPGHPSGRGDCVYKEGGSRHLEWMNKDCEFTEHALCQKNQ